MNFVITSHNLHHQESIVIMKPHLKETIFLEYRLTDKLMWDLWVNSCKWSFIGINPALKQVYRFTRIDFHLDSDLNPT